MPNKTQKIMAAIKDTAYLPSDGLADYHAAQAVKNALRRKDPHARLSGVREALRHYRVSAWFSDSFQIMLMLNGNPVLNLDE